MFCPRCGTENPQTAKFCVRCGHALPAAAPGVRSKRPRTGVHVGRGTALVLSAVGVALVLVLLILLLVGRPDQNVVLGATDRQGDVTLHLVKLGHALEGGVELAGDAAQVSATTFQYYDQQAALTRVETSYGWFVPSTDRLVYWTMDGPDVVVEAIRTNAKSPVELFRSDSPPLTGILWSNSNRAFFVETRGNQARCYAARGRGPAERVAKGDRCWVTPDGALVFYTDLRREETTLSVVAADGKNERILFEGIADVESIMTADDGSHAAFVQTTRRGQELYIVSSRGGEPVLVGDADYAIADYAFVPGRDVLVYTIEDDDGEQQLYTSDSTAPIAEGTSIGAVPSADGRYLVYAVGDRDGEVSIYVRPLRGKESMLVFEGDGLHFALLPSSRWMLILEQYRGDTMLYSADLRRGRTTELFREEDVSIASIRYAPESGTLYVLYRQESGLYGLYVTPVDRPEGLRLLEDWSRVSVLNESRNGKWIVFSGGEDPGDPIVLYAAEPAGKGTVVELDDDHDGYYNAVFAPGGKAVVYTGISSSGTTELDVLRAPINRSETPTVLYRDAFLVDVGWGSLSPFRSISWQSVR